MSGRAVLAKQFPFVAAVFGIIIVGVYLLLYFQTEAWQMLVIAGIVVMTAALLTLAPVSVPRHSIPRIESWMMYLPLAACIGGELVLSGATLYNTACGVLLIIFLCGEVTLSRKWHVCLGTLGLYVIYIYFVNQVEPLPRLDITQSAASYFYPLVLAALVIPIPVWRIVRLFRTGTIRDRLLVASILLVLLPTGIVGAVSIVGSLWHGRQQVTNQLQSVATLKEAEIDTWVNELKSDMNNVLADRETKRNVIELLSETTDSMDRRVARNKVQDRLIQSLEQTEQFEELFLVDINGRTVISTNPARVGQYHSVQPYFRGGLQGFYVHPPVYSPALGLVSVVAASPALDKRGDVIGVLVSRVSPEMLNEIMLERTGLGATGETYLVDRHHILLTGARLPMQEFTDAYFVFSEGANSALDTNENGSGSYDNYRDERVTGVYRWLPELQVALLAEQHESEAYGSMYATLRIGVGVAIAAVLAAALLSMFFTQSIAARLASLADTATRIASGDPERTAEVGRADEIGTLAQAFNSMTSQLRALIGSLEERVQERTRALEQRALQLETSAQVGREITSILDIDDLLTRVVALIREAFGYYQVLVFLVDEDAGRLALKAGTGEVGRQLKREGFSLEIGPASLNGEAARNNEAIVCQDVSLEPRYQVIYQLPGTKSELVVPLRIGTRVIGTLDVQADEPNAFSQEDIVVIQSLGDQVSIAIENARLYQQSRELAMLEERTRLARELHDSVTQSLFSLDLHARAIATHLKRNPEKAEEQIRQLRQITQESLREMRSLIFALRPYSMSEQGLAAALGQLVARERRLNGPEIEFRAEGKQQLPTDMEVGLFRVAQEALRNAVRHADAQNITITLEIRGKHICLCVADDGQGFDPSSLPADRQAFGLVGMKERVDLLGGRLKIISKTGTGTQVEVDAPIRGQERL